MLARRDPDIPAAGEHLWEWFWDLHQGRQAGMGGWLSLPATELKAWAEMTGTLIRPQEWRILRDMDGAFLAAVNAKDQPVIGSDEEMTPELLDVILGA